MNARARIDTVLADAAPALLAFFLRRVEPPADAADLMNETLIAAWRARRRLPVQAEAARKWCFGIARHVLLHHARSRRRRAAVVDRLRLAIEVAPPPTATAELTEVRAAVDGLPPQLAELIRLVHWDGFSITDAAELLGVPASTARSQHARAKELLRDALADPARPHARAEKLTEG